MRVTRAFLRAIKAENKMLSGLGTIGTLLMKLSGEYCKEWFRYTNEHAGKDKGKVFQQWMDREGRRAVRQKVALISTQLNHSHAGGAATSGAGGQKQPEKEQVAQLEPPHCDLAGDGGRIMDAFVTTTGAGQQDTREDAVARATAALSVAEVCLLCQELHMFSLRKQEGVQLPSTPR